MNTNWALWNNQNYQRLVNLNTGAYFSWITGTDTISYYRPGVSSPLDVVWQNETVAAENWEKIKNQVFFDKSSNESSEE